MTKHNANSRADDGGLFMIGKGTVFAAILNSKTDEVQGDYFSLGYNTSIELQLNKEIQKIKHSLSNKDVPVKDIVLSVEPVLTVNFQDYKTDNLRLALSALNVTNAKETETIDYTLTADGLAKGAFIVTKQAVGEVTITDEDGTTTYVENINYVLNRGNIFILPVAEQSGDVMTAGKLIVENTGVASTTVEFDQGGDISLALYIEMNNAYDDSGITRYKMHKVSLNIDTLPIKGDGNEQLSYTATFNLYESKAVKASGKSKFFNVEVVSIED